MLNDANNDETFAEYATFCPGTVSLDNLSRWWLKTDPCLSTKVDLLNLFFTNTSEGRFLKEKAAVIECVDQRIDPITFEPVVAIYIKLPAKYLTEYYLKFGDCKNKFDLADIK